MQERKIGIKGISPLELFGINNGNLTLIKQYFPKLKISARGNMIHVVGEENVIDDFEDKITQLITYVRKHGALTESRIDNVMIENPLEVLSDDGSEVILHGVKGNKIKARTLNQRKLVQAVNTKDMVFAVGPAGTGKTYTAVACAVRAFKNKQVRRIVLTRPAVEAGENLGFLPGDMKEKLDPYMMPLYDALRDMIPSEKLAEF